MKLSNLPGVTNVQIVEGLKSVTELARVAQNLPGSFADKYEGYCKWAMDAVRILSSLISQDDVARLINTIRHWSLVERTVVQGNETVGVLILLNTELSQRILQIEKVTLLLQNEIDRWKYYDGRLVVLDTNIYLHGEEQFDLVDWSAKLQVRRGEDIHIVLPILVIKELDSKKRASRGNPVSSTNSMEIRTRARLTLRKISEVLPEPDSIHYLNRVVSLGQGSVSITLLLNDVFHSALNDPDSEILERALMLQQATGREVTIVTFDVPMSLSAKHAGLKCKLLINESGGA